MPHDPPSCPKLQERICSCEASTTVNATGASSSTTGHITAHDDSSCRPTDSKHDIPDKTPTTPERWTACAQTMKQHDEDMVQGWKENIDTLLVFAGLFSSVLTAFTVESYQSLQEDPQDRIIQLLERISAQLSRQDASDSSLPTTQNFSPTSSAKRVNTLWFSALVCSLVVALIGILAKQWSREYLSEVSSSHREGVRLRQYRYEGLTKWRIVEIMAVLPVLLELALILFLVGLLDFLWNLDATVSIVVTLLIVASLTFYVATTVLPVFSASSPFKSPQAWAFLQTIWKLSRIKYLMRPLSRIRYCMHPSSILDDLSPEYIADIRFMPPGSWREREIELVRRSAGELDRRVLAWAYKQSLDDDYLDFLAPCANDLPPKAAASLIFEMIARRGDCSLHALVESIRFQRPRLGLDKFMSRAGIRGKERLMRMLLDLLPRMIYDTEHSSITAIDVVHTLRKLVVEAELAVCELSPHRRVLDTLALLMDERGPHHIQLSALHLLCEMTELRCNEIYCPEGIQNVALYAIHAFTRSEAEAFVRASYVLLTRLPALRAHIQDPEWHGQTWLKEYFRNLKGYFDTQNCQRLRYDVGMRIKWCSSLISLAELDKCLLGVDIVKALEDGARLGLMVCDSEERDALSRLEDIYVGELYRDPSNQPGYTLA